MLTTLLQLLLTVLGVSTSPDTAVLGVAVAVLALAALAFAVALVTPGRPKGSPPHPRRAIGVSTLLSDSHPDAAGHPRPRAPGAVRAV